MLKSKIHRARITDTDINYEGSITIDQKLMAVAGILPYEQVHVLNLNNGVRLTTYAIEGEQGEICLNGPAARQAVKEDIVTILTYCHIEDEKARNVKPKLVYVDANNAILETKHEIEAITLLKAE